MSTTIREALAGSEWSRRQDFMGKRLALLAIRLLVSANLLVCRDLSQVCRGARFGDPVHADVANGPRVGISAGISARVRSLRDGDSGSAPDPEDSQIWSGIDCSVDDCRNSQPHFRVGIWLVLYRCSHGDAAGCHLSLADAQAIPSGRTRKCGDDASHMSAHK